MSILAFLSSLAVSVYSAFWLAGITGWKVVLILFGLNFIGSALLTLGKELKKRGGVMRTLLYFALTATLSTLGAWNLLHGYLFCAAVALCGGVLTATEFAKALREN